jgi:hypothetical protein
MEYTGCLYDPAVIHKCVQVDRARSSAEAYGWELPLHDLRILAGRLTGIDVCVEHERGIAVGVVSRGFIDDRGRLLCTFSLFQRCSSNRVQGSTQSIADVNIAETVECWIRAGDLRELSLQHVRDTLEPLEVSIVVAGARPNSLIHSRRYTPVVVAATCVTPGSVNLGGQSCCCKRVVARHTDGIITITASQKSDIQQMNTTHEQDTHVQNKSAGSVQTGNSANTTSTMNDQINNGHIHGSDAGATEEEELDFDEHSSVDVAAIEHSSSRTAHMQDNPQLMEDDESNSLATRDRLQDVMTDHHERLFADEPKSLSILATAIKHILQTHQSGLQNGSQDSIRASADVEEDRLAAATAFVSGQIGTGGAAQEDYISPHICMAVRSAIDAIEGVDKSKNATPASMQEGTANNNASMLGHTSVLAASMWIEKLCEADKRASNQSHVHELDLVAASKTDLRQRIQAMFVGKPTVRGSKAPPREFDVELARVLTGTLRRGITALRASNASQNTVHTETSSGERGIHARQPGPGLDPSSALRRRTARPGNPRVRASITRDFKVDHTTQQRTRQRPPKRLKKDPFVLFGANNKGKDASGTLRRPNATNDRRRRQNRIAASGGDARDAYKQSDCSPPHKKPKKAWTPFDILRKDDAAFMKTMFNSADINKSSSVGVMTLRPMNAR